MSSEISYKTLVIAILCSVILSTGIIMTVPPVREAIRGPPGPQGVRGDTGSIEPSDAVFGDLILYDSGWFEIDPGTKQTICTLENENVFVYMIGHSPLFKSHQLRYGGDQWDIFGGQGVPGISPDAPPLPRPMVGASWHIDDSNNLIVGRYDLDVLYQQVRVIVWQLPDPTP